MLPVITTLHYVIFNFLINIPPSSIHILQNPEPKLHPIRRKKVDFHGLPSSSSISLISLVDNKKVVEKSIAKVKE